MVGAVSRPKLSVLVPAAQNQHILFWRSDCLQTAFKFLKTSRYFSRKAVSHLSYFTILVSVQWQLKHIKAGSLSTSAHPHPTVSTFQNMQATFFPTMLRHSKMIWRMLWHFDLQTASRLLLH